MVLLKSEVVLKAGSSAPDFNLLELTEKDTHLQIIQTIMDYW